MTAVPLVVFAYTCHPNVLPVYIELQSPSARRMDKVIRRSVLIAVILYLSLGIFAVLTFGNDTRPNFLYNDYHHSAAILIGCAGFTAAVVITVPLFVR